RRVAHDRDLPEELTVAERLELDLPPVRLLTLDDDLPLDDDEDLVGGSALTHDDLACSDVDRLQLTREAERLMPRQVPEDAVDDLALEVEAELLVVRAAALGVVDELQLRRRDPIEGDVRRLPLRVHVRVLLGER